MQKHIEKPVVLDNDADLAGFAESICGVSAGTDSSVFITLGTGVGGGLILFGKPWSGHHSAGGELGHIIMEIDGIPCTCGRSGCLERYCSATGADPHRQGGRASSSRKRAVGGVRRQSGEDERQDHLRLRQGRRPDGR